MSGTPPKPRTSLYQKITSSVPLLVTVIVHVVLIAVAGYFVVSEQIIGKKKSFEAPPPSDNSAVQKQVEHRLQVARKSGGASSSSPISASRIFSTAEGALQLPEMPELPQVGASALGGVGGFGGGAGVSGLGGSGYGTGVSATGGLGKGFMSLNFLGVTSQRSRKVVFAVDISADLLDIRKGGFQAFGILREEISRLVSRLSPSAEFNVVLFDRDDVRLFATTLQPANVENKTRFFEWVKPINTDMSALGARSIPASSPKWKRQIPESLKLDPDYRPNYWGRALHAALQVEPDTVFIITGSGGIGVNEISESELAERKRKRLQEAAELKRKGVDIDAIIAARNKALAQVRTDLNEANKKLIEQKKDPFVVTDIRRVVAPDFQAALKRAGVTLKIDYTGWTDKDGKPIWDSYYSVGDWTYADLKDVISYVSRLQNGLLRERASLNMFLFVGPDENTVTASKNFSQLVSRNGGKFELLTTKRLQEINKREQEKK